MVSTSKIVGASTVAAFALTAVVCMRGSTQDVGAGVARAPNSAVTKMATSQLKNVNPAALANVGKAVTQLVGPNASPKEYRKLAQEVACMTATKDKNLFLRNAACANVEWYGPNRNLFLPGKKEVVPDHLKGELPGDFGFDPFNLGQDDLEERAKEELYHGRWAMLGAAGILATDVLAKSGVPIEAKWWNVGKNLLDGQPIDYLGNPGFVHASSVGAIFAVQFFLMASAEVYRGWYESEEGSQGMYPGGAFDPLGFAKDENKAKELKIKEIKNGRLAMLAMLGFYTQAFTTGKTPLENLADHIANPIANHI
eukprot:CAMPEP_0114506402 /NCGR_PEP_ID=MMETSP0109-20121206/11407_1 /TAXON_ID=29199 /ORGANISM="Chlorarachnion reptans, Strain CCCM449" /LENGTH=310 /DNA_ID=CAMNT_0001684985 /DNA_START=80 /DNA_END=1012 /DNA_ORIENTATION=+